MKLYDLFPKFMSLSSVEREKFIRDYRERRAKDLERKSSTSTSDRRTSLSSLSSLLSPEEKFLLKSLGLKMKDLKALRKEA